MYHPRLKNFDLNLILTCNMYLDSPTDTRFKRKVSEKGVKESQAGILPEKSLKWLTLS